MGAPPRWRARIIRRRGKRELNSFRTCERRDRIDRSTALRHAAWLIRRTTESRPCRFPPVTTPPTSKCCPAWNRSSAGPACTPTPRRPNHLVQEVVDNSVDEALAGHARTVEVACTPTARCEVSDDGRGMPVDMPSGGRRPRRRADPDPPARRRKVQRPQLQLRRRPARRRRVGGQCAVVARRSHHPPRWPRVPHAFAHGESMRQAGNVAAGAQKRTGTTPALLARSQVFRLAEDLAAETEAPVARQSRAVRRPDSAAVR